jgi:hypothetical protein
MKEEATTKESDPSSLAASFRSLYPEFFCPQQKVRGNQKKTKKKFLFSLFSSFFVEAVFDLLLQRDAQVPSPCGESCEASASGAGVAGSEVHVWGFFLNRPRGIQESHQHSLELGSCPHALAATMSRTAFLCLSEPT